MPDANSRRRKRRLRRLLRQAQNGLCAGCGLAIGTGGEPPNSPLFPSFDHYDPRHLGGQRSLHNGLLKHRACNARRGDRLPNGCDMIWHWSVQAKLGVMLGWDDDRSSHARACAAGACEKRGREGRKHEDAQVGEDPCFDPRPVRPPLVTGDCPKISSN